MPDWLQTIVAALNSNKLSFSSTVVLVAIALLRVLSMYFEGCAKVLERYADYFWLIFVFCLAVLIVQFILYIKFRVDKYLTEKREQERLERVRTEKRSIGMQRFNRLSLKEREILFGAYANNKGPFKAHINKDEIANLLQQKYLVLINKTMSIPDWYDPVETVRLSDKTLDLLDECYIELVQIYEQDNMS